MRRRREAFSLVELLVVIGMIGALVAFLLPVLGKARSAAQLALCASNLRQLHQASVNYVTDNRGSLPPAHVDFITKNLHRWHGTRAGMSQPFDFTTSPLKRYLQVPAIKQCPSLSSAEPGFERSAGGYGYNNHYLGSSMAAPMTPGISILFRQIKYINVPARMASVERPAQTIMFADTAMSNPALIEYSFVEPPLASGFPTSPSIHFRHNGRANVAWLDGHITSQSMEWTYPGNNVYGANNSRASLGFFGPKDNSLFDRR